MVGRNDGGRVVKSALFHEGRQHVNANRDPDFGSSPRSRRFRKTLTRRRASGYALPMATRMRPYNLPYELFPKTFSSSVARFTRSSSGGRGREGIAVQVLSLRIPSGPDQSQKPQPNAPGAERAHALGWSYRSTHDYAPARSDAPSGSLPRLGRDVPGAERDAGNNDLRSLFQTWPRVDRLRRFRRPPRCEES